MGLGMSLSGLFNVGHDVGGFSGDKPDAELFVRWVQNGVMHPRFTIHSWNDDHTVNEPWMYPGVTPAIRGAIELRYRLLPYLYTLLWQAHTDDEPMLRPTFLDHEHDAQTFEENDDFLLGATCWWQAWWRPGSASDASGCRITKRAGTIFTPTSGSLAGSGSYVMRRWRNCRCWYVPVRVCRSANALRMSARKRHYP